MWVIITISIAVVAVFFSIQLLSLFAIDKSQKRLNNPDNHLPKVSILLAARNEEKLIRRSLFAIDALHYPKDKLEILIGDDDSDDKTNQLVKEFIIDKPHFKLFSINEQLGKARGKANVLAHLAHKATGEFYFITDVDVKLPNNWIQSLLNQFTEKIAIVSGTSTCEPTSSLFSKLQSIDWLHFMGYIQSFANIGIACTSVGNNMAVRAKAYWETGGYENIDFSITEDYKLFKEVTERGWGWRAILDTDSLGMAWHIPSFREMLHQRKRWLIGAQELPLLWKFLIVLYGLFVPAVIALLFFAPINALLLWLLKTVIQTLYIKKLSKKVGLVPYSVSNLLVYEIYLIINTLSTAVFYFLPIPSIWKGRTYHKSDLT
ncbi:MAG: glycosyltransferase [Bacteroidetes bacterium]|nr:glycosyltransferase [Bacteroidota bacterium]